MDRERPGLGHVFRAGNGGIGVTRAADHHLGAMAANGIDLGLARDLGHEDARGHTEAVGRIGHRRTVIAARSRRHASSGDVLAQERVEGAARLEGAGMLQEFELQRDRPVMTEIPPGQIHDRGAADVIADTRMGGADIIGADGQGHG